MMRWNKKAKKRRADVLEAPSISLIGRREGKRRGMRVWLFGYYYPMRRRRTYTCQGGPPSELHGRTGKLAHPLARAEHRKMRSRLLIPSVYSVHTTMALSLHAFGRSGWQCSRYNGSGSESGSPAIEREVTSGGASDFLRETDHHFLEGSDSVHTINMTCADRRE